jgi:primosomal protein N'
VCRGPSDVITEQFAESIGEKLEAEIASRDLPARLLGPTEAPIAKLQDKYRYHMLVTGADLDGIRAAVKAATADLKPPDHVQWVVDVDPLEML